MATLHAGHKNKKKDKRPDFEFLSRENISKEPDTVRSEKPKMGASDLFCLRWNDFESNISHSLKNLREESAFFDVHLLCDDDAHWEKLLAHKVILSACSPFFRRALGKLQNYPNPAIYLRGIKSQHLQNCLDFMYYGEVNVSQEDLKAFLAVAQDLQIKGFTQNNVKSEPGPSASSKRISEPPDRGVTALKRRRAPSNTSSTPLAKLSMPKTAPVDDDIEEITPGKMKYPGASMLEGTGEEELYPDGEDYQYKEAVEGDFDNGTQVGPSGGATAGTKDIRLIIKANSFTTEQGHYVCGICGKTLSYKCTLDRHFREIHYDSGIRYQCPEPSCQDIYGVRRQFMMHIANKHPNLKGINPEQFEFAVNTCD